MLLWPPGQNEKATKCHFLHKQQLFAVNNHEKVARGKSELSKMNQVLIPDIEEKPVYCSRSSRYSEKLTDDKKDYVAGSNLQAT